MVVAIKKRIKLVLFFIAFLIISPVVLLYANGDMLGTGWTLLSTGGIYVNAAPTGSDIYLNAKLKDTTSFFSKNLVIKSLRSGSYDIVVKKDGYNAWSKNIKVFNNLVSDANVFMLPEKVELVETPKYIASSTLKNPDYTSIDLIFTKKATTTKIISTTTIDFKSNLGTKLSPIMSGKIGLWREGYKIYSQWFGREDLAPRYFCNEVNCTSQTLVANLNALPRKIDFLPDYSGVAVIAIQDRIFAIQIEENAEKKEQIIYKGIAPDFRIIDGVLYVKDGVRIFEVIL